MQTKNVNLDNSQQQGAGSPAAHDNSLRQADDRSQQQQPRGVAGGDQAPPLPPRGPPLTPVHARLLQAAQVDGQGPYKPVPPPKPLAGGHSPPPYRMPPYPLYGETAIPGAAAAVGANPASTLHTHSSKFPIEREVILSSADKNSKIPILHEYKKRPKSTLTAIAPDGPAKQIAWTEDRKAVEGANGAEDPVVLTRIQHGLYGDLRHTSMGMEELSHHVYKAHPLQLHDGSRISKQQLNQGMSSDYRVQYRSANTIADSSPYLYNGGGGGASTGAVPRTWTVGARGEDTRSPQPPPVTSRPPPLLPHSPRRDHSAERRVDDKNTGDEERSNAQNAEMIAESSGKDGAAKDAEKNKAFSSRTLHTIKDMISSRFGGTKGTKESGGECVGEEDKPVESTLAASTSLNNNQTGGGGGGDKGQVGSPRKAGGNCAQREDGQGEERDQNHRQHVLGGGPQVIGPSRNYGDIHHGMGVGTGYQGRRGAVEGAESLDRARVAEAEDALRRSGRGRGGPLDHGVYATARNAQQAHYSRSVGDFSRELATQGQEPVYGCHAGSRQHQAGAKVLGGSRAANFGSQPGLLDQNGIYMVMRQPGSASQQVYGHYHQETEQHHDVRRCVVDNRAGPGQDRVAARAQGDESNPSRDPGRRGSQTHLDDEDDDDGGFLVEAGKSRKNPGEGAGQGGQHQSSGQSSDYEKATQRSTGQSSSNADSGRGSTIYSSGHKMVGAKRGEVCERLDTSTESSESPQALERRDNMYGNDSEWVDMVESELRQILDPKLHGLGHQPPPPAGANSTLSESISSLTPPAAPAVPGRGLQPRPVPQELRPLQAECQLAVRQQVGVLRRSQARGWQEGGPRDRRQQDAPQRRGQHPREPGRLGGSQRGQEPAATRQVAPGADGRQEDGPLAFRGQVREDASECVGVRAGLHRPDVDHHGPGLHAGRQHREQLQRRRPQHHHRRHRRPRHPQAARGAGEHVFRGVEVARCQEVRRSLPAL
ncbi:hornerin-like [Bacillus rossius redtenbacheri]|uniref:hornerin-like n=1 Tax=Bacillus rossius redtenbacheri TaxID=93214 RepID=UPI002FDD9DA6